MININNLSKYYGSETIFENVSLKINQNEKVGLVGPNGSGKTTLIKMIVGCEQPSKGSIHNEENCSIAYVPQYIEYTQHLTIMDLLLERYNELSEQLRLGESHMASCTEEDLEEILMAYQIKRDEFDQIGGDAIPLRAEKILHSLGLEGRGDQLVGTLSGGEKNILSLGKALLLNPDVLILDEPGNHLDYKGLAWLEDFLSHYKGSVLIVSHNRYLLDRVCEKIWAIEDQTVVECRGNYSYYRMNRLRALVNQQSDFIANQKKIKRIETLVKKFQVIATNTADPAWGKRLRAMKSRFDQEQRNGVEKPKEMEQKIEMEFQSERSKAHIALQIRGYSKSFDSLALFEGAEADIFCGEKVAILGANGSGKTTLVKDIVDSGGWENQILRVGPSLTVGYCSQHQEIFDPEKTLEDEIRDWGSLSRNDAFRIVSPFNFAYEDMDRKIKTLSGGEKNRLQMARLIYLKTNFLILDEPTNHLDIGSCEAVEEALADFEGTLLVVSHDRYFLEKTVDRIIEVKDKRLISFEGSFSQWWSSVNPLGQRSKSRVSTRGSDRRKQSGHENITERESLLERHIEDRELEKSALESSLSQAFAQGDHKQGRGFSEKLAKINSQIEKLYAEWEGLMI